MAFYNSGRKHVRKLCLLAKRDSLNAQFPEYLTLTQIQHMQLALSTNYPVQI